MKCRTEKHCYTIKESKGQWLKLMANVKYGQSSVFRTLIDELKNNMAHLLTLMRRSVAQKNHMYT